jgi:hypothetical protein
MTLATLSARTGENPDRRVTFLALLFSAALLAGCAHAPATSPSAAPAKDAPAPAGPPAAVLGMVAPSDVSAVPPHSGTIVYEAIQPDPSNMPRDLVLVLYADRKAALLDRVIGDPTTPFTMREGTWALSDAGSVLLYLHAPDGSEQQLVLKRGEGYLTGDGSSFGGGILYLREI